MIVNESLTPVITRQEIVISDWDGVIQFIEKAWLMGVQDNWEKFKPYFDESKMGIGTSKFIKDVMSRDEYYLNKWLSNGTEPTPELTKSFMDIYLNDPMFYDNCTFLKMAEVILEMSAEDYCKEIIFLTHVPTEEGIDMRKQYIFEDYFASKSTKFKLVTIPDSKSKCEWIAENKPDYTCFIDDRFDIIRDVVNNTDSANKTFMMPFLGYNRHFEDDKEFLSYIEAKGIEFATYQQSFIGW